LNYRFVVLGVLLLIIGGYMLASPGVVTPATAVGNRTVLLRVPQGSYSYVRTSLAPQQTLHVTLSSSPDGVDFFLMNSSNFQTWNATGSPPVDVYPQSKLNVNNYTFTSGGGGTSEDYALVLISRSTGTPASVLLHITIEDEPSLTETLVIPVLFVVAGFVLLAFGATRRKGAVPAEAVQ